MITGPHAARKLRSQGFRSPLALSNWQAHMMIRGDTTAEAGLPVNLRCLNGDTLRLRLAETG